MADKGTYSNRYIPPTGNRASNFYTSPEGVTYQRLASGQWMGPNGVTISDPEAYENEMATSSALADPNSYDAGIDYGSVVNPYTRNQASAGIGAEAANYLRTILPDNNLPSTVRDNPYEARLTALLDNPDSVANTGAYKFRFNQGQQALERSAAAKGMHGSGNTLAALADYGQGVAAQAYDTEADRLTGMVRDRNTFNTSERANDISAYGAQTGRVNALGELVNQGDQNRMNAGKLTLDAARSQSDDYWSKFNMALKARSQNNNSTGGARSYRSSSGGGNFNPGGFGGADDSQMAAHQRAIEEMNRTRAYLDNY